VLAVIKATRAGSKTVTRSGPAPGLIEPEQTGDARGQHGDQALSGQGGHGASIHVQIIKMDAGV
jgi:hypothetical protein